MENEKKYNLLNIFSIYFRTDHGSLKGWIRIRNILYCLKVKLIQAEDILSERKHAFS